MKLLEFPHSHYCEKARWALDYKSIPYSRVAILPGFHLRTIRRYAPRTTVPVLLTDEQAVQGSSEIIDFLDQHYPDRQLTPQSPQDQQYCQQLESELSDKVGEPIRTILYDRLLHHPEFIRYCFTHTLSGPKQFLFRLYYPLLKKLMHQAYVTSDEKVAEARSRFDQSLEELAAEIGSKQYLLEERFTRADLSVCAMLSLLILPPQFPLQWPQIPDKEVVSMALRCQDHPVCVWGRGIYELHRQPLMH